MATNYSLTDQLPRDSAGQPFAALINPDSASLDFVLTRAVAVSSVNAKNLGYQAVATHVSASALSSGQPIVLFGGITGEVPATVGFGDSQMVVVDRKGALKTVPRAYEFLASGSVAASADTAHSLYGNFDGLSDLGSWQVVHVSIQPSANNLALFPQVETNGRGWRMVSGNDYYIDLPAMTRDNASRLHFLNETSGSNAVVNWMIWH